jgi:hypothetical protein
VAACTSSSLEQLVRAEEVAPAALTRLSMERAVVAVRDGFAVRLVEFREQEGGWVRQELSRFGLGEAISGLHLQSLDGETGEEWNTFVYGAAAATVSRVQIEGYEGEGGRVVDGTWVVALRERGLGPDDLRWSFVDALGEVVEAGMGTSP